MPTPTEIHTLFLDPTQRHVAPEVGSIGATIARVTSIDAARRSVLATASTPNVDRYEEIVLPSAFAKRLPSFEANPVLPAGHTYVGESGQATVIGHWEDLKIDDGGLRGRAVFADTPLAEDYWKLYAGSHMKAFSVGWITPEGGWEMREHVMPDGSKKKLRTFVDVELIEISAVAIPANRESLVRAASAFRGTGPGAIQNQKSEIENPQLAARLAAELRNLLNTDPGGPLCVLIQDVVQATLAARGPQHDDDHGEAPADSGRLEQIDRALTQLKALLSGR